MNNYTKILPSINFIILVMDILKKLTENNFNEVAKLIENNQIPQQLMSGNIKNQLKKYRHAYTTPASISLAQKHQSTVKFGYRPSAKFGDNQVCDCCNLRVYNQEIPLCEKVQTEAKDPKDIMANPKQYKLTSDVALFLTFVKSCIFLTLLNSIVHSIFNLLTSEFYGKQCSALEKCKKVFWNTLSMPNKYGQQQWIFIVDILNLAGIFLTILFFAYNRRRQYRLRASIDCESQNESNYTLFVSNIPILQFPKKGEQIKRGDKLQFYYRKHLQQFFNNLIKSWLQTQGDWTQKKDKIGLQLQELMSKNNGQLRSSEVVKTVSLCYNLSRLEVLQQIKGQLVDTYQCKEQQGTSLWVGQQGQSLYSQRFASIPQRIGFLNDCQLVLNGEFARDSSFLFSVTHFVGKAFVSFQYKHYKEIIQRIAVQCPALLYYNGRYLKIEEASHPTDVSWQNMRVSVKERVRKSLASWLVLGLVLVVSCVVMLALQLVKQSYDTGDITSFLPSYGITLLIALLIVMINYVVSYAAQILTDSEKRQTRTDYSFSILVKTFITQLINTLVLFFLIAILFRTQQLQTLFMGTTGIVLQITTLITLITVLQLITSLIYPRDLCRRLRIWWRYRKCQDLVERKFQLTLNREFQYPEFNFASRYSYYLVTLYTAFFYSYLIPLTVPIVFVLFFIQYWVDKYIILRRSSIKYHLGFTLSNTASKLLESSIFLLGAGNLIFSNYMHNYTFTIINWVGFGLTTLFTVLVWLSPKKLETILFGSYEHNEKYTYDDCLHDGKFETTYWTQNPGTFLIEEEKVTGRRKAVNPALHRKSIGGDAFLSAFNS